jgi:hypothetical protein
LNQLRASSRYRDSQQGGQSLELSPGARASTSENMSKLRMSANGLGNCVQNFNSEHMTPYC